MNKIKMHKLKKKAIIHFNVTQTKFFFVQIIHIGRYLRIY